MLKVLVCAASRHGATVEVAATIGAALHAAGLESYVEAPADIESFDGFDAAVIGSGVYVGRWLEAGRALVERNHETLRTIPVWLFSSGPVGEPLRPGDDPADAAVLCELVSARGHRTFAGLVDRGRLGFAERAMVAAVKVPDGDYRPWTEIEAWAQSIAAELLAAG